MLDMALISINLFAIDNALTGVATISVSGDIAGGTMTTIGGNSAATNGNIQTQASIEPYKILHAL